MIPGPNILLEGPSGTGKTHAIRTLVERGLETFVLFTEPGMEVVGDISCEDGMHFNYIAPANPDWDDMISSADKINKLSYDALSRLPGIEKQKYAQFKTVLENLANFKCSRCGKEFGDVSSWGTDRALCIDSLSGLNIMAMNLVVGSKPTKGMQDWMVAQDNLERLIQKLCMDTQATFVLTAHLEREMDEVTGGVQLMASTLGKKLAPRLPRFFSDVVLCKREGAKFSWSTGASNVDLKARNLPISENIEPTFKLIFDKWMKSGGTIAKKEDKQ